MAEGLMVPSYGWKSGAPSDAASSPIQPPMVESPVMVSPADGEEFELRLRLYLDESEEESRSDSVGEMVEGVESDCTLVSSGEGRVGRGLLLVRLGEPHAPRNWEPSTADSSVRKMPGLLVAASNWLQSKNSKSGSSRSKEPNMSEPNMKGGEAAERRDSPLVFMTPYIFPISHRRTVDVEPVVVAQAGEGRVTDWRPTGAMLEPRCDQYGSDVVQYHAHAASTGALSERCAGYR